LVVLGDTNHGDAFLRGMKTLFQMAGIELRQTVIMTRISTTPGAVLQVALLLYYLLMTLL